MGSEMYKKRQLVVTVVVSVMWAVLLGRVASIQFMDHEKLYQQALSQREKPVVIRAERGKVLDRHGVELAVSLPSASYGLRPDDVEDAGAAVRALSDATGFSTASVRNMVNSDKSFLWLVRQADTGMARRLDASDIAGLNKIEESRRYYPLGGVGSQLIGYTDVDGRGIEGVEMYFDQQLSGYDGRAKILRDAKGRTVQSLDDPEIAPRDGNDVMLTIDWRIQEMLDEEISACVKRSGARWGGGLVVNAESGEILAMSNAPGFDPNDPASYSSRFDGNRRRNRIVTDMFEPGSTFKIVPFVEALESGVITESDEIDCEGGKYRIYRHTIDDTHEMGIVPASDVLIHSSNIGTVKIAEKIGNRKLYERARQMGFGTVLGVDFPNETPGNMPNPRDWSGLSLATISFGQGMAASPLQVAMSYAAVANGGNLLQPRLIRGVVDGDGLRPLDEEPVIIRRVMKEGTAQRVEALLRDVVLEGTGETATLPNVVIAGKTGTAQRVRDDGRGYEPGCYVSSFVGYTCDRSPRIVCLVMIDSPKGVYYGSQIAAPVFRNVVNRMLNMGDGTLTIPIAMETGNDVAESGIAGTMQHIGSSIRNLARLGFGISASADSISNGNDTRVARIKNNDRDNNSNITLTENGHLSMPDLTGLTLREAVHEAVSLDLAVDVNGSGVVIRQHPKAGAPVSPGTLCTIACEKR